MSLGYNRELDVFAMGDTAEIRAVLYDDEDHPVAADDLTSVDFTIQRPDKTQTSPTAGTIQSDGVATLDSAETDQVGQYTVVATFTKTSNNKQSVRADYEVIDPFKDDTPSPSYVAAVACWAKLEDCFDAEDEGPWLRDMTLNYFNKDKMEGFLNEALFDINQQNPPTGLTIDRFVMTDSSPTTDLPLLAEAMFVCVLRHLIRSYTEQPAPQGAQIAWHDRRDYLQRWQTVYQIEKEQYMRMLALWKRQFLGLGHSKVLVASKAGRLMPAPLRTRNVGRGYW